MQYIISWIDCFLLLQLLNMMSADPFREDCARMGTFKKKYHDSSLQNHVLEIIEVTHVALCSTACLNNAECQSHNFQETENVAKLCELSSSTENASIADFVPRSGYSYYDAEDDPECEPPCYSTGRCLHSCLGAVCSYRIHPASCKEVKESGLSNGDGEYDLYLLHPVCARTARVYCADMDTDNPLEYVTLSAGRDTNYALDNRLPGGAYPEDHGKTAYDKIRLEVPSLKVWTNDSRFSTQIEGTNVMQYAFAADCMWAATCEEYTQHRYGKTETNLTGTDFQFQSSIPYEVNSWPPECTRLIDPTMSSDRKTWSVSCGGHCGGCRPLSLILEVDDC